MFGKSKQDKLMEQVFELKFTARQLAKEAQKCAKAQKEEKLKVKKAIEKGNMDGARIYAQNAIRKKSEELNYLRLSSRLDGVVSRLNTQAKMQNVIGSMGGIVKALDSALASGNMEKITMTMGKFEKQLEDMDVMGEFVESTMAGSTALSTPEDEVSSMLSQVAEEYGLEVGTAMPQAGTVKPAVGEASSSAAQKDEADDLVQRLAALKNSS
eukprot:TRINITY_DN5237_c1_g5_i1.p1 TRINITY_DN5237_c1_g5~~TRINITY_DN5237_c1_g5_i1.p1  ORF type:complete len:212 (-),score=63.64 TRINITY_DN5237_c1_g5_i1:45-680(-)